MTSPSTTARIQPDLAQQGNVLKQTHNRIINWTIIQFLWGRDKSIQPTNKPISSYSTGNQSQNTEHIVIGNKRILSILFTLLDSGVYIQLSIYKCVPSPTQKKNLVVRFHQNVRIISQLKMTLYPPGPWRQVAMSLSRLAIYTFCS